MGQDFRLQLFLHGKASPFKKKKKYPQPNLDPSSPIQVLKQPCRKATVYILNQNPYYIPSSHLLD